MQPTMTGKGVTVVQETLDPTLMDVPRTQVRQVRQRVRQDDAAQPGPRRADLLVAAGVPQQQHHAAAARVAQRARLQRVGLHQEAHGLA